MIEASFPLLSCALKSNSTLTGLDLGCENKKKQNTKVASINNLLYCFLIKSTVCRLEDTGAALFGDALKTNTTLKTLILGRIHKKRAFVI